MEAKTEKDLKTLIRVVWDSADWKKIARARSKYDIYAHKLKAAAAQNKISRFLEKLCHSLGLQSVQIDPALIRRLEKEKDSVLKAVRQETIYYMLEALE